MIRKIKPNILQFYFENFGSCVYLLKINSKEILIDTSSREAREEFLEDLKKTNLQPEDINMILITHQHWDHNGNIDLFKNAKIYDYKNLIKNKINPEQTQGILFIEIKVIHVPGHTDDSIAFLYRDVLFSGDTLFHNGIGRTDLPESQPEKMHESLIKLKNLNYKILCPGHV
ncbi:MBL fold metallo-hydrolase [Candidatus Pacearchaeota archaeon]|nr:MBL fold metallo-hydrolase [Candidatus Pacearchaeota archaeon]MBD3282985.1 MBL fold metallo-hydrolase [Candidatus Pacearchaeota archaeon]